MTREETITNLKMIRVAFVEPVTEEQAKLIDDTFDMAIKALEQEPCDYYDTYNKTCRRSEVPQESKTDTWSIKEVADTLAKHGLIVEQEPCEDVLDKIRTEIDQMPSELTADGRRMIRRESVFQIIDKYKAESEVKDESI